MNLFGVMEVSGSALQAERIRAELAHRTHLLVDGLEAARVKSFEGPAAPRPRAALPCASHACASPAAWPERSRICGVVAAAGLPLSGAIARDRESLA